jgi:flagellar M-ring protein FliF
MKAFLDQLISVFNAMPTSKKISMVLVLSLVVGGFAVMFLWANQVNYSTLYSDLSPEDAGEIVSKLKEQRIPYKLTAGGTTLMVPADQVYELRLSLANNGLPAGGNVGFEIFDANNFSTTEFVQKLNYQRALQGELERTISDFREIDRARVLLVIPEESLFVEDSKSPSASVSLKLKSTLSSDKVSGIVHVVASAVEGLSPDQVTVVETGGKVLFKGSKEGDEAALFASNKLDYQREIEENVARRVQTMLEGIVGKGKAIVRASADITFDRIDLSEVKYNPDSRVIRSEQRSVETSRNNASDGGEVRLENTNQGTVPVQTPGSAGREAEKQNELVNYEINKTTRHITTPSGSISRLSVAAVVDGTYETVTAEDGSVTKSYEPRSEEELAEFEKLVKRAMGFSEDREDQVHVSSFAFSNSDIPAMEGEPPLDWPALIKEYSRVVINVALVFLVFIFVVRPLIKSVREVNSGGGKMQQQQRELPEGDEAKGQEGLPQPDMSDPRALTMKLAQDNSEKTEQLIRGWLNEEG